MWTTWLLSHLAPRNTSRTSKRSSPKFESMIYNLTQTSACLESRGKFLGFVLTHRGIEANLDMCDAIPQMKSPQNDFKQFLALPPVLTRLINSQDPYLYLVVLEHLISTVIVQEEGNSQSPIYYIRREIPILGDKEARPHLYHLSQTVAPLISFLYHGRLDRPPHLAGATKARIGRKDDDLIGGTI
ncbi:hypothetical protein CR513_00711, partial [Mucuna pruriens]